MCMRELLVAGPVTLSEAKRTMPEFRPPRCARGDDGRGTTGIEV